MKKHAKMHRNRIRLEITTWLLKRFGNTMETAKLKHLKKCSKLLEDSPILKLHFKSEIQRFQNIADGALKDQNEQFVQSKTSNVKAKNGQFECHWCFQVLLLWWNSDSNSKTEKCMSARGRNALYFRCTQFRHRIFLEMSNEICN